MQDTVVFSFCRMQPPTAGHEKLVNKVISVAKEHNADHVLFLSQSVKPGSDPLDWDDKKEIVRSFFPGVNISNDKAARTPFEALEILGKSYSKIILVVGGDRVKVFKKQTAIYLERWGIKEFSVVNAGDRNDAADGIGGVSATNARNAIMEQNYDKFVINMPASVSKQKIRKLYKKLNKELHSESR